jgi:hypothetical protein
MSIENKLTLREKTTMGLATVLIPIAFFIGMNKGKIAEHFANYSETAKPNKSYEIYMTCNKIGPNDTLTLDMGYDLQYTEKGQFYGYTCGGREKIAPMRSDPMKNLITANLYVSKKFPVSIYLREK